MSKVIHLSNNAHARAKDYCKNNGLRMSDWVAELIDGAVTPRKPATINYGVVSKHKVLPSLDASTQTTTEGVSAYAAPPFWKQA